jgi:hypothetical protein
MDLEISSASASCSWASTEFASLVCTDARRKRRFERVAANFLNQPGASIPNACGDWAGTKACYRLFDHKEVTDTWILEAHREATFRRLTLDDEDGFLLVIQDTSALNFSTRSEMEGLGPTASHGAGLEIEVPRGKQGLKGRSAKLTVRAGRVRLAVPAHKRKYLGLEESVELWFLEVIESDPPPGAVPVCWRLLTSEPVMTATDAKRLVACYALRWRIEMLFRILKSGCRVEQRQVHTVEKLKAFIALDLVIACRLLALTMQARSRPDEPAIGGREAALVCDSPPSEPCVRISRTRLSSQQFAPLRRLICSSRACSRLNSPSFSK